MPTLLSREIIHPGISTENESFLLVRIARRCRTEAITGDPQIVIKGYLNETSINQGGVTGQAAVQALKTRMNRIKASLINYGVWGPQIVMEKPVYLSSTQANYIYVKLYDSPRPKVAHPAPPKDPSARTAGGSEEQDAEVDVVTSFDLEKSETQTEVSVSVEGFKVMTFEATVTFDKDGKLHEVALASGVEADLFKKVRSRQSVGVTSVKIFVKVEGSLEVHKKITEAISGKVEAGLKVELNVSRWKLPIELKGYMDIDGKPGAEIMVTLVRF